MKIKFLSVLAAGLLVQMNEVRAQETLTLQQAIRYALENKVEAQKARLDVTNSQYQVDEVRSGALPQVSGSGTLTYNPMLQKSALPGDLIGQPGTTVMVAFGQKWQSNATLTVNQQIFNQALFTGLKAASTTREFYQINKDLTDEQLIEKVANAYYQVFQSRLQEKTIETNLNNTEKNRQVIQGLVEAGLAKRIDLDRTTVQVNNLKTQLQQARNTLEIQENALKFAIGMDITNEIVLPEETFAIDASVLETQSSNLNNRTEVRLLEKQAELLELDKKATIADYYPTLSFTGNLGYLGMGQSFPIFSKDVGVNWSGFSGLGLNLSIPIFNGGRTRAQVNQKNVEILRAKADLEDTKLALSMANENAKTQIKNSLLTISSSQANVQLAKEVLENTQNNYRNGLATLTELLDAENSYADAQTNYNTSLLNYKIAEVQLIKAKGELKTLVNE
ncbi:outer membrane protein TolC [Sphingobacterium allocomposti]|uniref:Outer membrane protein TolC n=1 Tax=Sphingobacterium allocomposti TaxID=415956 RepID=A0A5S5DPB9_9SPHI|nr:TolC family protein [Sphingobacterium composti Yoo et al. 2007 non Ten et al. 2007]TYP96539.1 outer membrane protein TolC [Sphingobacterium composti Yoo et al. 2007 non Ten et al. 2007]